MTVNISSKRIVSGMLLALLLALVPSAHGGMGEPGLPPIPVPFKAQDITGEFEAVMLKRLDGVYFPRLNVYRKGRVLVVSLKGEGGRFKFSYDGRDGAIKRIFIDPAGRYKIDPLGRSLRPGDKRTYPFGAYQVSQSVSPGCNDTDSSTLSIGSGPDSPSLVLRGLGNIFMYFLDLDANGVSELYLLNAYYCSGVTELYRVERKKE